jgi:hypothetical protein
VWFVPSGPVPQRVQRDKCGDLRCLPHVPHGTIPLRVQCDGVRELQRVHECWRRHVLREPRRAQQRLPHVWVHQRRRWQHVLHGVGRDVVDRLSHEFLWLLPRG